MSNFFEELGKKVVDELAHAAVEVVKDSVNKGAEALNDALKDKTPLPPPPSILKNEVKHEN
ncbi:MAG: hypothetical protein PHC75_10500 [Burkholderiales bacterium]|nr:hypothetical protein [Burkholderiales bacterium]